MHIGISGTRRGANQSHDQHARMCNKLRELFELPGPHTFHHGDCVGVDAQANDYVRLFHPEVRIVVHPPTNSSRRAWRAGDETRLARDYLDRNKDIVNECAALVIVPREQSMRIRGSGTWYTYRHAKAAGREVHLILPREDKHPS